MWPKIADSLTSMAAWALSFAAFAGVMWVVWDVLKLQWDWGATTLVWLALAAVSFILAVVIKTVLNLTQPKA